MTASGAGETVEAGVPVLACAAFQPVYWSEQDTAETIASVKEHNAVWAALCRPDGDDDGE